jgi:hypothetical protein
VHETLADAVHLLFLRLFGYRTIFASEAAEAERN